MYYSQSIKEITSKDPDSYSDFGMPYKNYPIISDPVDVCLPGSFFNPEKSSDIDFNNCPLYMADRCAKNWDEKCSLYVNSLDDGSLVKDFLRATASKKFCSLSKNSTCKEMCQPFNPIAQDSPVVCQNFGKDVLKDNSDNLDIGWYLPASTSPDYMGSSCEGTCDSKNIEQSDVVIDSCLKYGFCNDILTDVCKTSNFKVGHKGLQRFCDSISSSPSPDKNIPLKYASPIMLKKKETPPYMVYFLMVVFLFLMYLTLSKKRKH